MNSQKNSLFLFRSFYQITPIILFLGMFTSCKTAEELRRERMVSDLSYKMQESEKHLSANQKMTGSQAEKIQELQEQINNLTNKLEQLTHTLEQKNGQDVATEKAIQELTAKQTEMVARQEETKKYFDEVMSTLKKLKDVAAPSSKASRKKNSKNNASADAGAAGVQAGGGAAGASSKKGSSNEDRFQEAMKLSQNGDITKARSLLHEILEGKPTAREKSKIIYNLGLIEYGDKKYDTALTYFSKIVSTFTKSPYVANSYFFLGKSFAAINRPNEAKASFQELVKNFPKSDKVALSQKTMEELSK
jgi:TolA-binding protein